MKFGIDAVGFYSPNYYLDLRVLAEARGVDPEKYYTGLGQHKMAVSAPGEDIVTMAVNAATEILTPENRADIDTLIFATESGLDFSKAAGTYLHGLLELPSRCRVMEVKQACYAGTAGLQLGLDHLHRNPDKKVLVIASDIAYYGFNTTGESSQGAGAVALLLAKDPRLVILNSPSGFYTEDAYDFWRPNYCSVPFVDGRYSCDLYMRVLEKTWGQYSELSGFGFRDHDYFCYHVSVPKLVFKAHKRLARICGEKELSFDELTAQINPAMYYGREVGNCYTAALYIGLLSLLETTDALDNKRLGFYSYGSGCVGEFFSGVVVPGYQQGLQSHADYLAARQELSMQEYEQFASFTLPKDGSNFLIPPYNTGSFRLTAVDNHKRIYTKVDAKDANRT